MFANPTNYLNSLLLVQPKASDFYRRHSEREQGEGEEEEDVDVEMFNLIYPGMEKGSSAFDYLYEDEDEEQQKNDDDDEMDPLGTNRLM